MSRLIDKNMQYADVLLDRIRIKDKYGIFIAVLDMDRKEKNGDHVLLYKCYWGENLSSIIVSIVKEWQDGFSLNGLVEFEIIGNERRMGYGEIKLTFLAAS